MSDIADLVRAEIEKRVAIGKERYGEPLHTHDGRDGLQDSIEECADQLFYLVKEREERKELRARIAELERDVRDAKERLESALFGHDHTDSGEAAEALGILDAALKRSP